MWKSLMKWQDSNSTLKIKISEFMLICSNKFPVSLGDEISFITYQLMNERCLSYYLIFIYSSVKLEKLNQEAVKRWPCSFYCVGLAL